MKSRQTCGAPKNSRLRTRDGSNQQSPLAHLGNKDRSALTGIIGWSSFGFALLQSICTLFAAVDGFRVMLGISSLIISASVGSFLDRIHSDWIRIPMILFALAGSLLNIAVLIQVRHLRNRPVSKWRQIAPTRRKLRMEYLQLLLSVASLIFIGIEEFLHLRLFHLL
jgi:hypothetical protein